MATEPPSFPVTLYAQEHAPKDGIDVDGKHFEGGQFTPPQHARSIEDFRSSANAKDGSVYGSAVVGGGGIDSSLMPPEMGKAHEKLMAAQKRRDEVATKIYRKEFDKHFKDYIEGGAQEKKLEQVETKAFKPPVREGWTAQREKVVGGKDRNEHTLIHKDGIYAVATWLEKDGQWWGELLTKQRDKRTGTLAWEPCHNPKSGSPEKVMVEAERRSAWIAKNAKPKAETSPKAAKSASSKKDDFDRKMDKEWQEHLDDKSGVNYAAEVTPMPTVAYGAESLAHLEALGLQDSSRYHTLKSHPILDSHSPIVKKAKDASAVTDDNPDGLVEVEIPCTEDDLHEAARNSNAMVEAGYPPFLQIGHTPLKDGLPESHQPRPVGYATNYQVGAIDGKPFLFADLHYRVDQAREAITYPRLSVERVNWTDPQKHAIQAVALLRRQSERPVPLVPYEAKVMTDMLVCYGADLPAPGDDDEDEDEEPGPAEEAPKEKRKMKLDHDEMADLMGKLHEMITKTITECMSSMKGGDKGDDAMATDMPDDTAAANYADGMGAMGPDTGYVPDEESMKDPKKAAMMMKSCYAALKQVPVLTGQVRDLTTANAALQAKLDKVEGTVQAIDELNAFERASQVRANYQRKIDAAIEHGTLGLDTAEKQQTLLDAVLSQPPEKREPFLDFTLANYSRSSVNQRFTPQGGRNGHASGHDPVKLSQARMDWLTRHPAPDIATGIARFNKALAAGEVIIP